MGDGDITGLWVVIAWACWVAAILCWERAWALR